MKFAFDFILAKAPWLIRYMFYFFLVLGTLISGSFIAGFEFMPKVNAHIITVITSWAEPRSAKRDGEIAVVSTKLDSIAYAQNSQAEDIRDIRNALMDKNK